MVEGGRRVRGLRATVTAMAAGALSVTGVLATSPRPAGAAPTELFISEYVEGTSNNKAIEIFNGTGALVDLAADAYDLQYFFNGNPVAGLTINLTGSVADGDAYVVAQASANATILAQADQTNSSNWFNGDDAVVLRRAGVVIDSIGQAGVDPGTEWGAGLTSTADNTLRRKAAIEAGDPTPTDAFDPAVEWDGFATDTFDGLGAHGADTAPDVTTTSPADGAGDVAPGASVTITFSEPVVVTGDWFTISCATSGAHPAAVTGGPTTFVLQPDAPFTTGEACTVTVVAAAVSDQDTNDPPDTMAADVVFGFATGDPCAGPSTPLSQVQGSGATSPVAGTVVTVQGVVVGDHQGSGALQGFFVQEEDADADADPATSEGLFVFQGSSGADVAAGDVVRVTGTVTEFTSSGTQLTELASVTSVAVCGAGACCHADHAQLPRRRHRRPRAVRGHARAERRDAHRHRDLHPRALR